MGDTSRNLMRRWVYPTLGLAGVALVVFWGLYLGDFALSAPEAWSFERVFRTYVGFEAGTATEAGGVLAGIAAAILGIVITVASIIVQLTANRYAGVTRMFLSDRVSQMVLGYYIAVCAADVWLGPGVHAEFVPRITLLVLLVLTTLGLAMMVPYFGYVFWVLDPIHIVARIRRRAETLAERGVQELVPERRFSAQAGVLEAMEELSDICSSSISAKDKIIASEAVDALKDFALAYVAAKGASSRLWYQVGPQIRHNPDFVAMDPESLSELEQRRTWVEWKVMRQYLGIYNDALGSMRDINYLIAIDTRYIAEAAVAAKDPELLALVVRYMNSYLRATLNARDVRTAYNVLNQYRQLVEALLVAGWESEAVQALRQMRYYGHLGYEQKLTFVTETAAFDVSAVCELAFKLQRACEAEMLTEFLKLDQPAAVGVEEQALLGVRKAQVKLACFYLQQGVPERARQIADDMRQEPPERLASIRQQLAAVTSKDFWEIIDRGRNFEFMPGPQRDQLRVFFGWFDRDRPPVAP
jgi:Predicted membrane protein (DUF2254)